jgi:glycosyltransferase involved in cell wall biosynthesis
VNLLVIDQRCQLPEDRRFYEAVGRVGSTRLTLVTPVVWRREWGFVRAESRGDEGVRVIPSRTLFNFRQHRVLYPGLDKIVRAVAPDVVFVNAEPEDWLTWQAVRSTQRLSPGPQVVFLTWRNIEFAGSRIPYKLPWLHSRAERRVLSSGASGIAYCSEAPSLFAQLGVGRVTYVPPYVDTDLFAPVGEADESEGELLRVGFVGRFHRLKGGELLLRAMEGVPGVRLTMIGSGPEESRWKGLASRQGVPGGVRWLPAVAHHELPRYLRELDLLVLPSLTGHTWKEQFGRVLAEALACGVPVVGSSSGEIPRVVGDAGIVFPENDPVALRAAIETLRDNPTLRRELGLRGRKRMIGEHSIQATAPLFHAVLSASLR